MKTWRQKYNIKYGFDEDESHSLSDISKTTKIKLSIIKKAYERGRGAAISNSGSVRNAKTGNTGVRGPKMSPEQWGYGRAYGLVMKNPRQTGPSAPDRDLHIEALSV